MALINRVSRLFKADFHAVLDQIEEPEALLRQAIRDMEDDLAASEQGIALTAHDQDILCVRLDELESRLPEIAEELDLCFASGKDDLAKTLVRKKLETERLVKRLQAKSAANQKFLHDQRKALEDNRSTLDSLRQKADLIAKRPAACPERGFDVNDIGFAPGDVVVGEDEVEVAFLREKNKRSAS